MTTGAAQPDAVMTTDLTGILVTATETPTVPHLGVDQVTEVDSTGDSIGEVTGGTATTIGVGDPTAGDIHHPTSSETTRKTKEWLY